MSRKVPAANTPMLETERLVLRAVSANEVDSLHRISNEPDVRHYLWDGEPVSEATVKRPESPAILRMWRSGRRQDKSAGRHYG